MSSNRTISSSFPGLDQIEAQTRSLRSAVLSLEDYAEWSRADPTIPTVHGAVRPTDENRDDPDGLNLIFGLKALLYPRPPAISSALLSGGGAALPSCVQPPSSLRSKACSDDPGMPFCFPTSVSFAGIASLHVF
jgi:hypothetical protein